MPQGVKGDILSLYDIKRQFQVCAPYQLLLLITKYLFCFLLKTGYEASPLPVWLISPDSEHTSPHYISLLFLISREVIAAVESSFSVKAFDLRLTQWSDFSMGCF